MKEQLLDQLAEYTQRANSVVVEAAHIYANKQPGLEQQKGAYLASKVCSGLTIPVTRILLIDDFNVSARSLDTKDYLAWLADQGYAPDEVVMESDLIPSAQELLKEIKEIVPAKKLSAPRYDPWQVNGALGLWTPVGKVPLLTAGGRPSCALLDASFYLIKSKKGSVSFTILPYEYSPQQAATFAILSRINRFVPVVNLYFQIDNPNITIEAQSQNI